MSAPCRVQRLYPAVVAVIATAVIALSTTASRADAQRFAISYAAGAVSGAGLIRQKRSAKIQVRQGDQVEIAWTSDKPVNLHLHGYDIETQVRAGATATMRFLARATGRFAIETHGGGSHGHKTILYVEVHPR